MGSGGPSARFAGAIVLAVVGGLSACRSMSTSMDARDKSAKHESGSDVAVVDGAALEGDGATNDASPASTEARKADDAGALDAGLSKNDAGRDADTDPMANHHESRDELLALFSIKTFGERERQTILPDRFLRSVFGSDGPAHMNQGNKAIARHTISKERCLEGLSGIVLQTPEQREMCGAENMVPIWTKGKAAWFCIDVFEFPNKACELPMVWTAPTHAEKVCELQGKRLCSQTEWNIACRGDPEGGPDQRYAYGERLDLDVCNTNTSDTERRKKCRASDAKTAWETCATDTEPAGSFPQCRSRFGVFDQHGNVAEVMSRREGDVVYTQLKGSAWFYRELAKEPGEPVPESTPNKAGAYPDHCNFDPRWHVEKLSAAWHVNYHLGFRCCKNIP